MNSFRGNYTVLLENTVVVIAIVDVDVDFDVDVDGRWC